ncbi:hypothetical protein [Rhizobium phaseoli]|uniref:hypothetical protein n=1 Tax=Rhizobium phaseoli TaxID=396 RepID=UPI0007F11F77|nr:hypothetical protein [Rhizobium phaseoli]ANL33942.1 hypothetical protein AMC89_CH01869 [Rhizobium phaseoli]ANL97667.1 hypothetical protein AMC79_CH01864 [Rhizobium phaseoli]
MLRTKADVFIIESLDPDDEGNGRFEGSVISSILRLHGKQPKYRYVRTREEFEEALVEFGKSRYRYLHISAHGDTEGLCTTNLESVDFDELGDMLRPYLNDKRLFLSACSMVHEDMAAYVIPKTGCFSVMGPEDDIEFHRAALFWASLYHLMFLKDAEKFSRPRLIETLTKVSDLFEVNIKFFYRSQSARGFGEADVHPEKTANRKLGKH